jgi:hypothetical protein
MTFKSSAAVVASAGADGGWLAAVAGESAGRGFPVAAVWPAAGDSTVAGAAEAAALCDGAVAAPPTALSPTAAAGFAAVDGVLASGVAVAAGGLATPAAGPVEFVFPQAPATTAITTSINQPILLLCSVRIIQHPYVGEFHRVNLQCQSSALP